MIHWKMKIMIQAGKAIQIQSNQGQIQLDQLESDSTIILGNVHSIQCHLMTIGIFGFQIVGNFSTIQFNQLECISTICNECHRKFP